jgi:hypothetical protein
VFPGTTSSTRIAISRILLSPFITIEMASRRPLRPRNPRLAAFAPLARPSGNSRGVLEKGVGKGKLACDRCQTISPFPFAEDIVDVLQAAE